MMQRQQPFLILTELLLTAIGGALIASSLLPHITAGALPVLSSATLLAGLICLLQRSERLPDLPGQLHISATTALATLLLLLATSLQPGNSGALLAQAAAVALLMFAASGAVRLLYRIEMSHAGAVLTVITLLLLGTTLPLWLGPLIDRLLPGRSLIDAVVALSPLGYLAAWDQWDYLRSGWFYHYSPIGSLRFDYPSLLLSSTFCVLLGLLPDLFRRWQRRHLTPTHPVHHPTGDPLR